MNIIHRYLILNFLRVFIITVFAFSSLFYIIDFFNHIDFVIKYHADAGEIISYFASEFPLFIYWILPIIMSVSLLLSLGLLSKKNEILIMRVFGMKMFNVVKPIIIFSLILIVFLFFIGEKFLPTCAAKMDYIENVKIKKRKQMQWAKCNNMVMKAGFVDLKNNRGLNIELYIMDKNKIVKIIKAKKCLFEEKLKLFNGRQLKIENNIINYSNFPAKTINTTFDKNLFLRISMPISIFTLKELVQYTKQYPRKASFYKSILYHKITFPISVLIVIIISVPFVLRMTERKGEFIKYTTVGMLFSFAYIGSCMLFLSLGKLQLLPPLLSSISPHLIFLFIATYDLIKLGE
jgi:lipopolysaccharide export system permease protein